MVLSQQVKYFPYFRILLTKQKSLRILLLISLSIKNKITGLLQNFDIYQYCTFNATIIISAYQVELGLYRSKRVKNFFYSKSTRVRAQKLFVILNKHSAGRD